MIIIGDLHGEIKTLEKILKAFKNEKLLFVGDYLDSFTSTDNEIIDTLLLVLSTESIVLVGNHELNYYNSWEFTGYCSGYRKTIQEKIGEILKNNQTKFKLVYYDKDNKILYSHAGVSLGWLSLTYPDIKDLKSLEYYIEKWERLNPFTLKYESPLFAVGHARMGNSPYGGPLWSDWNREFQPIPYIKQIFGHTPIERIRMTYIKDSVNSWNVDCLLHNDEVLEINQTGKIEVRRF